MGDQDDGFALFAQPTQNAEQLVGLGGGQHAGGFVQDQDVGLPVQRLEDFDALLHPHAQILDHGVGVHVQPVFFLQRHQLLAGLAQGGRQRPAVLGAQNDIFQHGEVFDQLEMLEHHADACCNCGLAVGNVGFGAADENLASVGFVKDVEDAHQGGFACAVLADDPVDRAGHHADRDVLVGLHGAKGLGYAFEFNRGGNGGG